MDKITKDDVKRTFKLPSNFRLDLIPDATTTTATETQVKNLSQPDLLDAMIGALENVTDERKMRLTNLWKDLT